MLPAMEVSAAKYRWQKLDEWSYEFPLVGQLSIGGERILFHVAETHFREGSSIAGVWEQVFLKTSGESQAIVVFFSVMEDDGCGSDALHGLLPLTSFFLVRSGGRSPDQNGNPHHARGQCAEYEQGTAYKDSLIFRNGEYADSGQ